MGDQGYNTSLGGEIPFSPVGLPRAQSTKRETAAKCNECGSPLSDSSQFCWMCGASRDREHDPRVDRARPALGNSASVAKSAAAAGTFVASIKSSAQPSAAGPSLRSPATASGSNTLGADELLAVSQCSAPEHQASAQRTYRLTSKSTEPEELKQFDVRTVIALVLFLVLICLGYWQRDKAKALFGFFRAEIAQQPSPGTGQQSSQLQDSSARTSSP